MTDSKKHKPLEKANIVRPIPLTFLNGVNSVDIDITIPFPVKKIKYISSSWFTIDGFLIAALNAPLYLRSSDIPQCNYLALFGPANNRNSTPYEIVYPTPIEIRGSHRFELCELSGLVHVADKDILLLVVLSFEQE